MRKFWIPVILTLVVGAIVSAQSLIESATAAAGGSAAGVAGKQVSDGLDKVFGSVGGVAKKAAGTDTGFKKTTSAVPPVPEVRIPGQPAAAAASPATAAGRQAPGKRQASNRGPASAGSAAEVEPGQTAPAVAAAPPAPLPTMDDLKSLNGATREEVTSKMGKAYSRITMSDESGLVEIVSFKGEGGKLGSVRMVNGKVTEVRPVAQ